MRGSIETQASKFIHLVEQTAVRNKCNKGFIIRIMMNFWGYYLLTY